MKYTLEAVTNRETLVEAYYGLLAATLSKNLEQYEYYSKLITTNNAVLTLSDMLHKTTDDILFKTLIHYYSLTISQMKCYMFYKDDFIEAVKNIESGGWCKLSDESNAKLQQLVDEDLASWFVKPISPGDSFINSEIVSK